MKLVSDRRLTCKIIAAGYIELLDSYVIYKKLKATLDHKSDKPLLTGHLVPYYQKHHFDNLVFKMYVL